MSLNHHIYSREMGKSLSEPRLKRCPDCGELVNKYFDHAKVDCLVAAREAKKI